jgi:predicted MPP superfamily phosphohydrolase
VFNGDSFLIHGVDDATTGRADVRKLTDGMDPLHVHLLLTHTIDVFTDIKENTIDLSFSGHSHGGQIRLPFIGALYTHTMTGRAYAEGIRKLKGSVCCISRGIGASRSFRIRFLCKPEAVLLTVSGGAA